MRRLGLLLIGLTAGLVLPFVLLVRVAVWGYERGWPSWFAVVTGVLAAALAGSAVAWLGIRRLPRRPRWRTVFFWAALPATLGFAGHGLATLAADRAKTAAERADWRRTHPLLRLSVATITLVDDGLVVTDLSRDLEDYANWGLPPLETSQHLPQPDGYSHAMDLRTLGRGALRNWLLQSWFRAMGFRTLRHTGTADHLHVGLPLRD